MTVSLKTLALAAAAVVTLVIPPAAAQTNGEKLDITAFAVNMSNIGTGSSAVVQISVKEWSTPMQSGHLPILMAKHPACSEKPIDG